MRGPAERLRCHLAGLSAADMGALSERAGVHPKIGMLARAGRPVSADAYLRFCTVAGVDPVMGVTTQPTTPGYLRWRAFASGLIVRRQVENLRLRGAAKKIGVSAATLSRAENGKAICIDSYLKIVAFIGVSPFRYCAQKTPPAERSTGNGHCNTQPAAQRAV